MDRFAAMNAFVRVVEAGSFTKAADTLNVPKATVTRLVQALEDQIHVRLLHRSRRAVTLTGEGASYYQGAVRLLADLGDLESSTAQSQARPSGRLRIDVGVAVGTMVLVPALPEFCTKYPDIELEIGLGNRDIDLVAENVDCAIRVGVVAEPDLIARRIGEFRVVACASPAYIEAHGMPVAPADLQRGHRTIGMISARTGRPIPFMFSKDSQEIHLRGSHKVLLNDTNACLAAALAGLGILQAPAFVVQPSLASGALVPVLEDWRTAVIPVQIVYPPNRYLSIKVRAFIDWTVGLFARTEGMTLDKEKQP